MNERKTVRERASVASKIAQFILDWWPEAALGTTSLLAAYVSCFPNNKITLFSHPLPWNLFILIIILILAISGGIGMVRKRTSIVRLEDALENSRSISSAYMLDTRRLFEHALLQLAKDCGLSNEEGCCKSDTRISIYCHDGKNSRFVKIARICGNPSLSNSGRSSYPDDEGVIAEGWRIGAARYQSAAQTDEEWVVEQEEYMDKATAEAITMKSKSIIAWRIGDGNNPVGVFVIESLVKSRATAQLRRVVKESSWSDPIYRFVETVRDSHVRRVAEATSLEDVQA